MNQSFTHPQRAALILGDGLLLLLALYGTLFSFLTAFSVPVEGSVLLWRILWLGLAALLVFSLPKWIYRLILSAIWLLVLAWLVREERSTLYLGALAAAQPVGTLIARQLGPGFSGPDFSAQLGGLSLVEQTSAVTLLVSTVLALLALWLGWAVVRRRSFWLAFWSSFPILLIPLTITITPSGLPLAALLLFWATGVLTRLVRRRDPWGSVKLMLFSLPLTALLLAAVAVVPQRYYQSAPWIAPARQAALDRAAGVGRSILASGPLSGLSEVRTEVNLRQAGPLRFTGATVLRVESEITGHIYLRGFSAGTYTAMGWEQVDEALYEQFADGWSSQPLNLPAALHDLGPSRRFAIEGGGLAAGHMYTPYQLVTKPEQMTGGEFFQDAYLSRDAGIRRYVLYAKPSLLPETDGNFTVVLSPDEQAYQAFVQQAYLDVPEKLKPTLDAFFMGFGQALAQRIFEEDQGLGLPASVFNARGIARLLAQATEYDANTPYTPEGEDFVEYFLTTSKRGYCMHYASAATLLLRSMGIPARYVTGYTADVKAGQTVAVPDKSAHAWVEVYVNGYGWYPVEVTPGFPGQSSGTGDGGAPSPTPSNRPILPEEDPRPSRAPNTPPPASAAKKGITWAQAAPYVLPAGGLALLLLLVCLRRSFARRLRKRRFAGADVNRAVIAMYLYQQRLLRFHWKGALSSEAELLGQRAKFSQHTLSEEERSKMLEHVRVLAGRTAALPGRWRQISLRYLRAFL